MKNYGIYSITNAINGRKYIGQTGVTFEKRWQQHKKELSSSKHHNDKLQRAWNKYGEDSFEFKVEHLCDELDDLNRLEIYYIYKYDSFENGYNLTIGGYGAEGCNEEERKRNLENRRQLMYKVRGYSVKQIEIAKILFTKIDANLGSGKADEYVSEKTRIPKNVVQNIRLGISYTDIREDLNEIIREKFLTLKYNDEIIKMFTKKEMTIKLISNILNVEQSFVKYRLRKNNIKYSDINKERVNNSKKSAVIELYNSGERKLCNFKNKLHIAESTIHKILDENGTSIRKAKTKIRINREKNCNIKGINWDIKNQRWIVKHRFPGKEIVVDITKDLEEAKIIKQECIEVNTLEGVMDIKKKCAKPGRPKRTVIVLNMQDTFLYEVEGIGVTSKMLNVPKKSIEKVLSGQQKSTYGYKFMYKEDYEALKKVS